VVCPLFIDELMGIGADRFEAEETKKNLIKEAKGRKVFVLFEILAERINI
jgi:hypothetical protein